MFCPLVTTAAPAVQAGQIDDEDVAAEAAELQVACLQAVGTLEIEGCWAHAASRQPHLLNVEAGRALQQRLLHVPPSCSVC